MTIFASELFKFFIQNSLVAVFLLFQGTVAYSYETDPLTHRLVDIEDSTALLNKEVNLALSEVIKDWKGPKNNIKLVKQVYLKLGGHHWVDKLEKYVNKSDSIEKLPTKRYQSFYADFPLWASRVTKLMGVGPIFKLNQQLVGTDKLGHFFSQGKKFYMRFNKLGSVKQAAQKSAFTERAIFGQKTTGTYSNADLVANFEGFLFYRSFFEDDVIPGKQALFKWHDGHWQLQRSFDWKDHVNAYWDEGINLNYYDKWLQPHVRTVFLAQCPQFSASPESYEIDQSIELQLIEKYKDLRLRPNLELKLSNLCETQSVNHRAIIFN